MCLSTGEYRWFPAERIDNQIHVSVPAAPFLYNCTSICDNSKVTSDEGRSIRCLVSIHRDPVTEPIKSLEISYGLLNDIENCDTKRGCDPSTWDFDNKKYEYLIGGVRGVPGTLRKFGKNRKKTHKNGRTVGMLVTEKPHENFGKTKKPHKNSPRTAKPQTSDTLILLVKKS